MAQNIADIRETIGINDKTIAVCAMENINITELNKARSETGNKTKVENANSMDLTENMIIPVSTGNKPNRPEEIEMGE